MSVLRTLASLKLALVAMLWLAATILTQYRNDDGGMLWIIAPLAVLAVNLSAALCVTPQFRHQAGLMVFHLCLLAVVVLAGYGQLTALQARLEISKGQRFDPHLLQIKRRGPWHSLVAFEEVQAEQGDFRVDYAARVARGKTVSQVWLTHADGKRQPVWFGDNVPLRINAYRFYTTSNKGYSVLLTWLGDDDQRATGVVHMPSYPRYDWKQVRAWTTPAGNDVSIELHVPRAVPEAAAWVFDSRGARGVLSIAAGGQTHRLRPGDAIELPNGRLRFEQVRTWMGYEMYYDATLPWMFAVAIVGVAGLAWHFWIKLWTQPLSVAQQQQQVIDDGDPVRI